VRKTVVKTHLNSQQVLKVARLYFENLGFRDLQNSLQAAFYRVGGYYSISSMRATNFSISARRHGRVG
jgi:catechol-2,3-dioxygenase